jgi:hypothetical protein
VVIEHTFITTLEATDALSRASTLLQEGGFEVAGNSAFQLGANAWTELEAKRGKKNPARARDATQAPQLVRLEWDRGRVNLAASVTPNPTHVGSLRWGTVAVTASPTGRQAKRMKPYVDLMTSVARSVELLLSSQLPPDEARREWVQVEQGIIAAGRRKRRRHILIACIFVLMMAGLVAFVVWTASHS